MKRGWTQQEVADRIIRRSRDPHTSVTADIVSKWERGRRGISARYRGLLAAVFGVTIDDLGLPGLSRGQSQGQRDGSLVSMVDQAAELLDQLGDAGNVVRPQVLAALTDEVMSRRTMLAFIDTPEPAPTPPSPDELDALTGHYEAIHGTASPSALLTALTAHLRMIADALSRDPSTGTRQRLQRNRARVCVLAGQLSEDVGNTMGARAYYAQAVDDAYELGDLPVAAIAHGYAARLALTEGQAAAAGRHLDTAGHLDVTDPGIVSWLAEVAAHVHGSSAETTPHGAALPATPRPAEMAKTAPAVRWFTGRTTPARSATPTEPGNAEVPARIGPRRIPTKPATTTGRRAS
jgi:transcriptional regulator with XRE-family HTH domain